MMSSKNAELLLIVVTLIAAAGWYFSKNALAELPAFSFLALRFSLASGILLLFCIPALKRLNKQEIGKCLLSGLVLGSALLFWVMGLKNTHSIGEGSFVVSLTVLTVPLVGRILFGEPITKLLLLALFPAIGGLALLTLDNGFQLEAGQGYYLIATLGFALHLNLSSHYVDNIAPLPNSALQLSVVGIIGMLSSVTFDTLPTAISSSTWGWVAASALIATSLRFSLQTRALSAMKPSHASMIFLLEPVWTALLGIVLLSENLSLAKQFGCVLIFTSLLVFRWPQLLSWLRERKKSH